jgi:MFS family permease
LGAYRRLLAAYTLNEMAWAVGSLALAFLVYRRTGSALGASAFFVCSQVAPALAAPFLVARIDRRPARALLPILYAGECATFLALAVVARHFSLVPVLALALLDGLMAMTARPIARATTVSVTTSAGLLREGNALANTAFSLSYMISPAIGGAVVAAGGVSVALLINSGLFALVALDLGMSRSLPAPATDSAATGSARVRLRAGLDYVRTHPVLRTLMTIRISAMVFFTMSVPVEVVLAEHTLHSGARGYGGLMSAWGAGAVVGSAVFTRWRRAEARVLMALGATLIGLGFLGMASAPVLAVALVGAAIGGAGNGVESIASDTALQEATASAWLVLVTSFSSSLGQVMPGVGILFGGALTSLAGARTALGVGAIGSLLAAAAIWLLLHPRRASMRAISEPPL